MILKIPSYLLQSSFFDPVTISRLTLMVERSVEAARLGVRRWMKLQEFVGEFQTEGEIGIGGT